MLRYQDTDGRLAPVLTIVKTRGSDHDRRTHAITVGEGGMVVERSRTTRAGDG
jgi:circadian clock protein KaiC